LTKGLVTPEKQTLADELIATEHARRDATCRGDVAAIEGFLADSFYYAHISGLVEDREQFLVRTRANPHGIRFTKAWDMAVELREGYALLKGKSRVESVITFDCLFLSIWERKSGAWKMTAYASTPQQGFDVKALASTFAP
jgi:hypothetical protein